MAGKKSPITNAELMAARQFWIENPGERGDYHVVKSCRKFIQLSKCSFHLRKEYWKEYDSTLWCALFDAFRTWDGSTTLFSWCWRLQMQCTWRIIQSITSKARKLEGTVTLDIDASEEDDYCFPTELFDADTPETIYDRKSDDRFYVEKLRLILSRVLKGPVEVEVYARMNGLFDFEKQKKAEVAEDMRLSLSTVDAIASQNSNRMSVFRKFIREEELDCYDDWIMDYWQTQKNRK